MHWILIYWLIGTSTGGTPTSHDVSTHSVEFDTQAACQAALTTLQSIDVDQDVERNGVCTSKGGV